MEYMYTFPLSFLKYWKHTIDAQLNLQRLLGHFGFHVGNYMDWGEGTDDREKLKKIWFWHKWEGVRRND